MITCGEDKKERERERERAGGRMSAECTRARVYPMNIEELCWLQKDYVG